MDKVKVAITIENREDGLLNLRLVETSFWGNLTTHMLAVGKKWRPAGVREVKEEDGGITIVAELGSLDAVLTSLNLSNSFIHPL